MCLWIYKLNYHKNQIQLKDSGWRSNRTHASYMCSQEHECGIFLEGTKFCVIVDPDWNHSIKVSMPGV
jgi:hypothetical protein